jgi:hypothetical protein
VQSLASDTHSQCVLGVSAARAGHSHATIADSAARAGAAIGLLIQSLASDAHSQAERTYSAVQLVKSLASDAQSAAQQTYSRVLLTASLASDTHSQAARTYSAVQAGLAAIVLTAAERNAIADAHLDRADAIETGVTPRQAHRLEVAAAAGVTSGMATAAPLVKNPAGTKTRVTAVADVDGNRTSITLTDLT